MYFKKLTDDRVIKFAYFVGKFLKLTFGSRISWTNIFTDHRAHLEIEFHGNVHSKVTIVYFIEKFMVTYFVMFSSSHVVDHRVILLESFLKLTFEFHGL